VKALPVAPDVCSSEKVRSVLKAARTAAGQQGQPARRTEGQSTRRKCNIRHHHSSHHHVVCSFNRQRQIVLCCFVSPLSAVHCTGQRRDWHTHTAETSTQGSATGVQHTPRLYSDFHALSCCCRRCGLCGAEKSRLCPLSCAVPSGTNTLRQNRTPRIQCSTLTERYMAACLH